MKIVLDTNVFISAIFWDSPSSKLLEKLILGRHEIYSSVEIIDELTEVLQRDFYLTPEVAGDKIRKISVFTRHVSPSKKVKIVKEDPDDDKII